MEANDWWHGSSPGDRLVRILLAPSSWLYALGWECYLLTYTLKLKRPKHPHDKIVCIGNLVAGGSGKTPLTIRMIDVLQELGYSVVVSCSGYGSPRSEAASLAPDGELDAREWGDEPALIRWYRPHVPMIVGRRRVLAAEICANEYPESVLVMDDGFQHLPLQKDITIVLDRPDEPNTMCFPAGPYREPRWNRKRADLVVPNGYKIETSRGGFVDELGSEVTLGKCNVLCAIARPERLAASVEAQGGTVVQRVFLPDHDPLTAGTLLSQFELDVPIVVTSKDWVKLRNRPDVDSRRFLIARHEVTLQPEHQFAEWIKNKLDGKNA